MDEIQVARQKFEQLAKDALRKHGYSKQDKWNEANDYNWLAAAAEVAQQKCEKYYSKVDELPAYYTAILLDPTLKNLWYYQVQNRNEAKWPWIDTATTAVREFWIDEYRGKFSNGIATPSYVSRALALKENSFTSIKNYKHLKLCHYKPDGEPEVPLIDHYNEFITTDIIALSNNEEFNPIEY